MKIRCVSVILSIIVILLTIVSCVKLPTVETSDESESVSSRSESTESKSDSENSNEESTEQSSSELSSETSEANTSSDESTPDTSEPEQSTEPSEEPSEEISEEVSIPPVEINLPYPSYDKINKSNIGSSELDAYFANSMFIGHSVMLHFKNYVNAKLNSDDTFLGNPIIFASASFSALNDLQAISDKSVHPELTVNGKKTKMKCADAVKTSGVDTVYLSLMALNELGIWGSSRDSAEETFQSTVKVINSILEKSPNVKIVILANTYVVYNPAPDCMFNCKGALNNENISSLNNKMLVYCNEKGYDFIDVATFLMDGNALNEIYCIDNGPGGCGCHLNQDAYAKWTAALRNYAYLKQLGQYKNPTEMPRYKKNCK